MGSFIGHLVPGLALACLGLWHTINTIRAYHLKGSSNFKPMNHINKIMHGAVVCGSFEADSRARALANLQFCWIFSAILVVMVCICVAFGGDAVRRQSLEYDRVSSTGARDTLSTVGLKQIQAVEAARAAAKNISDNLDEDSESSKDDDAEASFVEEKTDDENDQQRKPALDKLEKASEESILGHGLKVLDTSVESLTSGAWQAFGTALRGGATLVNKIENSASNFAESIQQGGLPGSTGSVAPSLLETGKAFTAKGMQVLELVGKETMDLLISETGIQVDENNDGTIDEDQLFEEINFDRCFYIYGGPEQLEELEALSNHYALLYNRKKAKLSSEQKSIYDEKLKEVQHIFDLGAELDENVTDSLKGKKVDAESDENIDELKIIHDSGIRKAAELAAGFANALAGLAPNDIIQRSSGRLDSLHSEGVHRLSEMCCFAVTQLLMLGKSVISISNKVSDQEVDEKTEKIDWPEDCLERAKIIRNKAQSITGNMEAVFNSFITGISDVAEAYLSAIKSATADSKEVVPQKSVQEKANAFTENLRNDHSTAVRKMQDGLQYLTYVVISTSVPAA